MQLTWCFQYSTTISSNTSSQARRTFGERHLKTHRASVMRAMVATLRTACPATASHNFPHSGEQRSSLHPRRLGTARKHACQPCKLQQVPMQDAHVGSIRGPWFGLGKHNYRHTWQGARPIDFLLHSSSFPTRRATSNLSEVHDAWTRSSPRRFFATSRNKQLHGEDGQRGVPSMRNRKKTGQRLSSIFCKIALPDCTFRVSLTSPNEQDSKALSSLHCGGRSL